MIIRKAIFVLSIACLSFGLNACKSRGGSSNQAQVTVSMADNSKTCLSWDGTYSGVIPCADCAGIEVEVSLKTDSTYRVSWKYMGKNDEKYVNEGAFTWDSTGSIITFKNMDSDKYPTMYKVCQRYLLQLDLSGNIITGEMADKYVLNKR